MFNIILNIPGFCNGLSHTILPEKHRLFCSFIRQLRKFSCDLAAAERQQKNALPGGVQRAPSEQTPSPQLSHAQLGAYFWIGFSNGLLPSFLLVALGIRLNVPSSVSSNHRAISGSPVLNKPLLRGTSSDSFAYSSMFGTNQDFLSLCVPNREKCWVCVLPYSWKTVLFSTLVSPFPFCLHCTISPARCQ